MQNKTKTILLMGTLLFLMILFAFTEILTGTAHISISELFSILFGKGESPEKVLIVKEIRFPRTIAAIFSGAALSVSGLQMQTIFRNPLAGPYVLGISSGAAFGTALLLLGFSGSVSFLAGNWAIAIAAWVGAGVVLFLLLLVSLRVKDITAILVLGVLFGSAISAIVGLMQYFGQAKSLKTFIIWSMGSLGGITYAQLWVLVISVTLGFFFTFLTLKNLDILQLGENYAKNMGVNIVFSRLLIFTGTGILAGTVTAFCGPISFVGIIIPHIARMIFRTTQHRVLLPASAFLGAILLLFADIISRMPANGGILPLSSITAVLGIPFVIVIILKSKLS